MLKKYNYLILSCFIFVQTYAQTVINSPNCVPTVTNVSCETATILDVQSGYIGINTNNICIPTTNSEYCDPTGLVQDVWYKFTAPLSGGIQFAYGGATNTNSKSIAILKGTCGNFEVVYCANYDSTSMNYNGLEPGATYYIRVASTPATEDTFSFNIGPYCSSPYNIYATDITMSNVNITWTRTSNYYEYVLDQNSNNPASNGNQIYTENISYSGLNPATTYYFHVRTDCRNGSYSPWSTISFNTLYTGAFINDDCEGALQIPVSDSFNSAIIIASLAGATNSEIANPFIPDPGCANYVGGDAWYTLIVPATGNVTIETAYLPGSTVTDTGLAIYSGFCNNLELIECNDDYGGWFSRIDIAGRLPGEILNARVWRFGAATDKINTAGEFKIGAYDATLKIDSFELDDLSIYPNPVKNTLNISNGKSIESIIIYNLLGQIVLNKKVDSINTEIDMSHLNSGTYLAKIITNAGTMKTVNVVKE
ncbi:T9SS type A sorting domain-containing protein [Flavobacterium sp.]|uniref:T9SS type A sorting domain-containing protein n=1 Tax=Flavobacterium sp. TaxID=239 RepID=UPI00374DAF37